MATSRGPGQRAGLTREQVVAAARGILAERGADGLSMRAVAGRLGVAPNALYSHVANKAALLDDVLDEVLAAVDAPAPPRGEPLAGLHALLTSTLHVLLDHPELVPLFVSRQGARGPNARRLGEVMLELLRRAGVTDATAAAEAQRVLVIYTIGCAAFGTRTPLEVAGPVPQAEIRDSFERGLWWLLAGISG